MSKREDEKFAAWVEEMAAAIPDAKRAAWRELVSDADEVVRERFYRGTLRTEDYYTKLNESNEAKRKAEELQKELYTWYEEQAPKNEALIAERDMLREQLDTLGTEIPGAAGLPGITSEDIAELKTKAAKVDQLDRMLPEVLADIAAYVKDSVKNGYEVNDREVMRLSLQQGVSPYKAYEQMTAGERAKKYEAERETEKKKWMEEGRRQAISTSTGSPDHIRASGPSVVDYLRENKNEAMSDRSARVAAALAELETGTY
jgi:hypothetical protein